MPFLFQCSFGGARGVDRFIHSISSTLTTHILTLLSLVKSIPCLNASMLCIKLRQYHSRSTGDPIANAGPLLSNQDLQVSIGSVRGQGSRISRRNSIVWCEYLASFVRLRVCKCIERAKTSSRSQCGMGIEGLAFWVIYAENGTTLQSLTGPYLHTPGLASWSPSSDSVNCIRDCLAGDGRILGPPIFSRRHAVLRGANNGACLRSGCIENV